MILYVVLRVPPLLSPDWAWLDPQLLYPAQHFYIVSATALVSLIVSIVIGIVGGRQRNLQVVYVSLAFISLAGFFSMHGLSTPNFILGPNAIVGVAAELSVLTMSFWLLVSSLPAHNSLSTFLSGYSRFLVPVYTAIIFALGLVVFANPLLANYIPITNEPLKYFAGVITIILAGVAGFRYWQSYRYSKFPFQLAIAYTGGWIAVTQVIITTGVVFYASWWLYHLLLLFSMIAVVIGLVIQYRHGDFIIRSILGLFSDDPNERLAAGISPSVRQLVQTTEARDPYTAGHSHRVSQGAFDLGTALKVPPEDLRVLVQGGIVHDIGKLEVPDEVLNKPGPLTAEERKVIEKHPVYGFELCSRLGFMSPELSIIRSHHERMDGKGYPDGLSGDRIPRLARLMSVIDVWDALTSARAYRPAWSEEEAVEYLKQNRGSHFDPELVDTWIAVIKSRKKA